MQTRNEIHDYNIRHHNDLHIANYILQILKNKREIIGCELQNNLPGKLKNIESIPKFKRELKYSL